MGLDQTILGILVNRIKTGGINPVTNAVMTVDDIKIKEYKDEVVRLLAV